MTIVWIAWNIIHEKHAWYRIFYIVSENVKHEYINQFIIYRGCKDVFWCIYYFTHLQAIQLIHQPLADIHRNTFWGLSTLRRLHIIGSRLHRMPSLSNKSCSLEELDLSGNFISNSGLIFTENFSMLKNLSLASNQLTFMPDFQQLALSLTYLDLSNNCLSSVHNLYRVQFIKLTKLVLHDTCIIHISLFKLLMPRLSSFAIHDNLLSAMEPIDNLKLDIELPNYSDYLLLVDMAGNPWHCNDSLSWLYENLRTPDYSKEEFAHLYYRDTSLKIAIAAHVYVTCQTPDQFNGKDILDMCKYTCFIHKLEPMISIV